VSELLNTAQLRRCAECGQSLPRDWDWDVRALTWMHDLPRTISPTNNDLQIHDGVNGRNRWLHLEFKPDARKLTVGQSWHLEGLSKLPPYTVLVVRGRRVDRISVQQVRDGRFDEAVDTTAESLNKAIASWLNGGLWRDASTVFGQRLRRIGVPSGKPGHTHGWAQTDSLTWTCMQDFYAVGVAPETACGETWTDPHPMKESA
jgi:hypothetical protein